MSGISLKFVKASLFYLFIGTAMGLLILLGYWELTASHVHLLLIGWVSMIIFGVGYHIIPIFAGAELYSTKMANVHFWVQNIGLVGLAATLPFRPLATDIVMIFGAISFIGIFMFIYIILRSLKPVEDE